jgi:hypothetical protein
VTPTATKTVATPAAPLHQRSMVRFILALAAVLALAAPVSAADRRYAIADFDRVVVEGPYEVRLAVGRASSASASGGSQALDAVSIDVQGTTLRVRRNRNSWTAAPNAGAPVVVTLTTRNLRSARIAGAGRLDLTGARGLRVELALDGGGRLSATGIAADNLALALRGAGTLIVAGTAKQLAVEVQGAGSLDGSGLTADDATVAASTSGEIVLNVRRTATVTANGLGSVIVTGNPVCTVRGIAAGSVRCGRR